MISAFQHDWLVSIFVCFKSTFYAHYAVPQLSHTERYVVVRSLRCLYLINSHNDCLKHRLDRVPPGVFVETMTCYTGADFNPTDDMVVASR